MKAKVAYRNCQNSSAKIIATLFIFTCAMSIPTCWSKSYGDATIKRVLRVYDGDTFTADIKEFTVSTDGKKKVLKELGF